MGFDFTTKSVLFFARFKPENIKERWAQFSWRQAVKDARGSRRLILLIVAIAIFLDNMLLTVVVPIVPNFLYEQEHPNFTTHLSYTGRTREYSCKILEGNGHVLKHFSRLEDAELKCNATTISNTNTTTGLNRHTLLAEENVRVGLMFASKAIVQLLTNPIVGPLTNRVGYSLPMFSGFVIMFISSIIFAFGNDYGVLLFARAMQGVGSSCSSVAGMGMIATYYTDDRERGNAMAFALGGLALGVLVGPPFGGMMYELVSKEAPFIILAFLALFDGLLQLMVLKPSYRPENQKGASIANLLLDPYVLLAVGSICLANMGIAMMEPSLPLHMMDIMNSSKWEQGAAFLPASVSYLIGTNAFGPLAFKMGRWLAALIGMLLIAICLFAIPFAQTLGELIAPNFGLGFAIGMVDSSMMPTLGNLVDRRHISVYGTVYAIGDVAFCLGFALGMVDSSMMPTLGFIVDIRHVGIYGSVYALGDMAFCLGYAVGPALSGSIVKAVGFKWMLWISALTNLIYLPFLVFLRNPPGKDESSKNLIEGGGEYTTYNDESTKFQRLQDSADERAFNPTTTGTDQPPPQQHPLSEMGAAGAYESETPVTVHSSGEPDGESMSLRHPARLKAGNRFEKPLEHGLT